MMEQSLVESKVMQMTSKRNSQIAYSNTTFGFCDFWNQFKIDDNPLRDILSTFCEPAPKGEVPDILVYSDFGRSHTRLASDETTKIYYTRENIPPNYAECDYGISFDHIEFGDRHLRFPYYAMGLEPGLLKNRGALTSYDLQARQGFCAYIASNSAWAAPERRDFVQILNTLGEVVSAGKHLRNHAPVDTLIEVGSQWERKLAFLGGFRFCIAFENSSHPGYTTEKIIHAFRSRCIPIYWGDPKIADDFNPNAFVNVHDFPDLTSAAQKVIEIDNDPEILLKMFNAPVFRSGNDRVAEYNQQLESFLRNIVKQPAEIRRRRPRHGRGRMVEIDARGVVAQLRNSWRGMRQERREREMEKGPTR